MAPDAVVDPQEPIAGEEFAELNCSVRALCVKLPRSATAVDIIFRLLAMVMIAGNVFVPAPERIRLL